MTLIKKIESHLSKSMSQKNKGRYNYFEGESLIVIRKEST